MLMVTNHSGAGPLQIEIVHGRRNDHFDENKYDCGHPPVQRINLDGVTIRDAILHFRVGL